MAVRASERTGRGEKETVKLPLPIAFTQLLKAWELRASYAEEYLAQKKERPARQSHKHIGRASFRSQMDRGAQHLFHSAP